MSLIKRGQVWEHVSAGHTRLVVLTLKQPKRGWSEWVCLVLLGAHAGRTDSFCVANSSWWTRLT